MHAFQNTVIRRNPSALSSKLDGEAVILEMESGKYHGLDSAGTRIWDLLEGSIVFDDIISQLMREYSVEREKCMLEVAEFINQMKI